MQNKRIHEFICSKIHEFFSCQGHILYHFELVDADEVDVLGDCDADPGDCVAVPVEGDCDAVDTEGDVVDGVTVVVLVPGTLFFAHAVILTDNATINNTTANFFIRYFLLVFD